MNFLLPAINLALLVALVGCQTTRPTSYSFSVPVFQGTVQPIVDPVTIGATPLNRRVALSGETNIEVIEGSKTTRVTTGLDGYAESYRISGKTQVTLGINRVSQNGTWQTIQPIIVQFDLDSDHKAERISIGGAILDQATPEQRQQINELSKALTKIVSRSKAAGPYRQGDVLMSISASDFLGEIGVALSDMRGKAIAGGGVTGRLVGETSLQGRRMFLVAMDGNIEISDASGRASASIGGYYLIDALTGIYAANHVLSQVVGSGRGTTFSHRELQKTTLRF